MPVPGAPRKPSQKKYQAGVQKNSLTDNRGRKLPLSDESDEAVSASQSNPRKRQKMSRCPNAEHTPKEF